MGNISLQTVRPGATVPEVPMATHAKVFAGAGVCALVLLASPGPASAQVACAAAVDGRSVTGFTSPRHPLEIDASSTARIQARAPADATDVRVEAAFPFASQRIASATVAPGNVYDDTVKVSDVAPFGVGLYRVRIESGSCKQTVWVRITGRSPFTTAVGITATVMLLAGVALLLVGIVRGMSRRGGLVRATVGGALTGLGALLLAQQLGRVGMTERGLVTWVVLPGLAGAALHQASAFLLASAPAGAPTPSAALPPTAAPPTAPPPPPPVTTPPSAAPPAAPAPSAAAPAAPAPAAPSIALPSDGAGVAAERATGARVAAERATAARVDADPPRSAYARIDAPEAVVAEDEFVLVVGLSRTQVPDVVGGPLVRPPTSVGPYTLVVQVVADGFTLSGETDWRRELPVTAADPYPEVVYHLRANRENADVWSRPIQALFSVDGQTMGMAVRSVAIVSHAELLHHAPPAPPAPAAVVTVAPQTDAADITVRILHGESTSDGRLLWTFETTAGVDVPDEPIATDIGSHPADFARQLIAGVASHRGRPTLLPFLQGIGQTVSEQVPTELIDLLHEVATRVHDRPVRVLLLSEEPYVPWELAVVDPPIVADAPQFLGAQVDVGRWVLGQRRPPLPPPPEVDVADVVVVAGEYPSVQWRLLDAEEEAAEIARRWSAIPVDAVAISVLDCLTGTPPADVLHFAVHGSYAPDGVLEGLILVDGDTLDPMAVKGCKFARAPFVFLNACQVGSGNAVLGDYAGLAAAFLHAGAAAVVAPLWSIDDTAAKELALRFYTEVLDQGRRPAEVLRDERRAFASDGAATRLAYQYFGHPALAIRVRHSTARRTS